MRDFKTWFSTMRPCINGYGYYVDFETVFKKAEENKVSLFMMNSLLGSKNIEEDFINLVKRDSSILKCIPVLLAVRCEERRNEEIFARDEEGEFSYNFFHQNYPVEQYVVFMRKTGLFRLLSEHLLSNLYDYCIGVETGLNSNARKNRGGTQMEDLVERYIKKTNTEYYKEMYDTEVETKWGLDLSSITAKKKSQKRFDFVVRASETVYVIETNFYTDSGSKLNETARSYEMLAEHARSVRGVKFVWVTDGAGWKSAKGNLEQTFNAMEHLYNIADLEKGAFERLFRD